IRDNITWREGKGPSLSYDSWTPARKQELNAAFAAAWQWLANGRMNFQGTPLPEPPTNELTLADSDYPTTGLSEATTRGWYFAFVGHILALEIRQDLPWSLCDNPQTVSRVLIHSNHFTVPPGNELPGGGFAYTFWTRVTPAHPTVTYAFLVDNGLIGATRLETIAKLIDWSRRLRHFGGGVTAATAEAPRQDRGGPPVSRTLAGTVATPESEPGFSQIAHWTMGCQGTMGFLKNLLMSVSILVEPTWIKDDACPHATPFFASEGLYLDHGDAPYSFFMPDNTTVFPPLGALLIDQATYTSWF